jgi:ERCC4-type nuclease
MPLNRRHPTILVDSRERKPLLFPGIKSVRTTLKTGDYSIRGFTNCCVVEYKSLSDYVKWLSFHDAKRFNSQLERLLDIPHSVVVVGAPLGTRSPYCSMHSDTIVERTAQITVYGLPIVFCRGRKQAARFVVEFLTRGVKNAKALAYANDELSSV